MSLCMSPTLNLFGITVFTYMTRNPDLNYFKLQTAMQTLGSMKMYHTVVFTVRVMVMTV